MTKDPIRDIPAYKKTRQDIDNLSAVKDAMPLLRPLLRLIGIKSDQIDEALAGVDELRPLIEELVSIPDRFNDLFVERGWIIYESMNLEVAKEAIKMAENGDIEGGEAALVNYYDAETVDWNLRQMNNVKTFRSRMPLAQKALIDYKEGRYHACVPVVLAILDGMVNESHEKGVGLRKGFFAEGVKLEAWDSISAHSKGLKVLTGILGKRRTTTTTHQITIPYRNGILHGMDLGYDNVMVAAKTWAALFAVRVWAMKAEQGLLDPQPPEMPTSWGDIFRQISENIKIEAQLKEWHPRTLKLGQDVPATGSPEIFKEGTPERKLAEFLSYWKDNNYGYMAKYAKSDGHDLKTMPARVREIYVSKRLQSFEFIEISDLAPAITMIQTKLIYEENARRAEEVVKFRMINADAEGKAAISGTPGSSWVIQNWDIAFFVSQR